MNDEDSKKNATYIAQLQVTKDKIKIFFQARDFF